MNNLNEIVVRIKADTSNFDNPIDAIRGGLPQFWRGNDMAFGIGVFAGTSVLSVANYASISLAIRRMASDGSAPSAGAPALMQKVCTLLDDSVTRETWDAGTKEHAKISFSATESNIAPGDHWLSIWATTDDATPKIVTLCAGIIRVLEVGGGDASCPLEPVSIYYSAEQCDSKFIPLTAIDTNVNLGTSATAIPSQNAVKSYVDAKAWEGGGEFGTASNIGAGAGIFKERVGIDLQFKTLKAGNNVTISAGSSEITIASAAGGSSGGMANPMMEAGDMIVGGTSGAATRLEKGAAGQVLKVGADSLEWGDASSSGGMANPMTEVGDMIVGGTSGAATRLEKGAAGQVLKVGADGLEWGDANSSYILPAATTETLGGIIPDGTTIEVNPNTGIASATGGGGSDGWLPSANSENLSLGASGSVFTSPADGWINIEGISSNANGIIVINVNNGQYSDNSYSYSSGREHHLLCPVSKNDTFTVTYSGFSSTGGIISGRFIYAKGAL
ncbi:MAG: hypothetical protein LBI56_04415 [Puniceicoccales bacterium]|jgi:hypothetical protein|nr:hypothetical protein [Puniceicoccales bacterium]